MRTITLIEPKWSVSRNLIAFTTTRQGGVSNSPYGLGTGQPGGLNLASNVGDNFIHVAENRRIVRAQTHTQPVWLNQTHSTKAIELTKDSNPAMWLTADASYSFDEEVSCAVLTADCLPILVTDKWAKFVGAIHAGWRGLSNGIIEVTMDQVFSAGKKVKPNDCLAWLGPAISSAAFEVGEEVLAQFVQNANPDDRSKTEMQFVPNPDKPGFYYADLYGLAKIRLKRLGFARVTGGDHCTFSERNKFYSYRRDGVTGRMLTVIHKRAKMR